MTRIILLLIVLCFAAPVLAVEPDEILDDPALEARAREISAGLRCVVCQNENIDSSNAPLARDLRLLVRERIEAGDTDEEIIEYVTARYGDFVLLKPPFRIDTLLLWIGPALFLLIGGGLAFLFYRRLSVGGETPAPLSEAERRRVEALVGGKSASDKGGRT